VGLAGVGMEVGGGGGEELGGPVEVDGAGGERKEDQPRASPRGRGGQLNNKQFI